MFRLLRSCLTVALLASVVGCSLLPQRDPVSISVVGIEPLPAQEVELRFAIKLRLQNPNETPIEYDGVAVNLDVNGRPLASGVSSQHGRIERYSEDVLVVPVSVSALTALRQAVGLNPVQSLNGLPYRLHGKLAGGAVRDGALQRQRYLESTLRNGLLSADGVANRAILGMHHAG